MPTLSAGDRELLARHFGPHLRDIDDESPTPRTSPAASGPRRPSYNVAGNGFVAPLLDDPRDGLGSTAGGRLIIELGLGALACGIFALLVVLLT